MQIWLFVAALNGLAAVVAGAFGWHWLQADPGMREIFNIGVSYHMWHALALLAVAWLAERKPLPARVAGIGFTGGIVLFSGTLYAFALTGELPLSGLAPVGGVLLMAGWGAMIWGATRRT